MAKRVDIAFRYSALGDLILCSGFVKKHASFVGSPLYFVTQTALAPIIQNKFPHHPELSVKAYTFKGAAGLWRALRSGYALGKMIFESHRPKQMTFYDLHDVPKSAAFGFGVWLSLLSKPVSITLVKNSKHSLLRQLSIWIGRDLLPPRWIYLEHQKLLPSSEIFTPELRHSTFDGPTTILLAPAASKWKKEWPLQHWLELIGNFAAKSPGLRLRVAAPADHPLTDKLHIELYVKYPQIEWLRSLSVIDLPEVAAKASLCICSNSAWLHLAEATGVPVIALEGPIVAGFGFAPWRKQSASFARTELTCRPCTKHGGGACRLSGENFHACMTKILPEAVFHLAVEKVSKDTGVTA